jgi:hypothetical protein
MRVTGRFGTDVRLITLPLRGFNYTKLFHLVRDLYLLERWYDYRTTDWATHLEYPEFTMKEVNRLLQFPT